MAKAPKVLKIKISRWNRAAAKYEDRFQEGTLEELIKHFSYTLEVGASWAHEKGNSKVNRNPKNGAALVVNLNNATNNAAANGHSGVSYSLVTE